MPANDAYDAWKTRRVSIDPHVMGGEPTFAGTRLTIRHIGGMLLRHGERAAAEIAEDYPYLAPEDLEYARVFTEREPRTARPRRRSAPCA